MKRRTRIIIGIAIAGISLLCVFYFLPKESTLYLKSDTADFKKSIIPIAIILSIAITLSIVFDHNEYNGKKLSKILYILYLGMMCYIIYPMIAVTVLTLGLKINRISNGESINKNFIVTIKDNFGDISNTVWGRIPNKTYNGGIDKLQLNQKDYDLVKENQEIELKLDRGLFGIPFNPTIKHENN